MLENFYGNNNIAFPAEFVARIFKGNYPTLKWDKDFTGKKICDISCGDGRNFPVLKQCKFDIYATEITQEQVDSLNQTHKGITAKKGANDLLPFEDKFFDYLLAWNCSYYFNKGTTYQNGVREYARILKKDGYLVLSIPKKTSFIYKNSVPQNDGTVMITSDPYSYRNGTCLYMFDNEEEIISAYSEYFMDFIFGSVHDDCFGYNYHWHLVVCKRK